MWKYVKYEDKYLGEMINMTIENYGLEESISHLEFVSHEYFKNPSGNAIVELAFDEEKDVIAGQYVINPHKFKVYDEIINSVLSLNTLTREAYRGQRIFTGLAEKSFEKAAEQGFGFCYGAPNPNSYPGFIKKLSFITLCEMPLYLRPLNFSKIVKEKTNKFLGVLCCPMNLLLFQKKVDDQNIIELTKENITIMDFFWDSIKTKYSIIGVRDSAYISYRYLDVPTRKYFPYVYMKDSKPVAFIVARIRKVADMTTGMIADFLYIDGYEKEAIKLVKYINIKIKQNGAGLVGCIMMAHSNEAKILKKAHFIKCPSKVLPQSTPLIIRVFDNGLKDKGIMDINNWFFTTGDYDVV